MSKCSDDGHVCSGHSTSSSVHQTLDELDFERGIWTAALNGDLLDVKKHLERNTDSDVRDSSGYTALVINLTLSYTSERPLLIYLV